MRREGLSCYRVPECYNSDVRMDYRNLGEFQKNM